MRETIIRVPLRLRVRPDHPTPVAAPFDPAAIFGPALPPGSQPDWRRLQLLREPDDVPLPLEVHPLGDAADGRFELAFIARSGVDRYRLEAPLTEGGAGLGESWRQVGFAAVEWSPEPGELLAGRAGERIVARYLYSPGGKPYFHPLNGPAGIALTRLGDPPDPQGRRHQHALWIGHRGIDGVNFWDDSPGHGRQVHLGFQDLRDGGVAAAWTAILRWDNPLGAEVLRETRRCRLWDLGGGESALDLELTFHAAAPVRLERTPFGLLGLRVANRLAPRAGGRITSSTGAVDEAEVLHTRARWCDVSGPVRPEEWNGIAVFDHDRNPHHPCFWHVRDDGWIGASLCHEQEITVSEANPLAVRYRILLHHGDAADGAVAARYESYLEPPEVIFAEAEAAQAEGR